MNISLIKLITMLSGFVGILAGFLTACPFIGGFVFFILICGVAIIIMSFMLKLQVLNLESIQESAVIGGIIGFMSFIAFSLVHFPLVLILLRVFGYSTNYGVALAINNSNLFMLIFLSLFMAILSATINAFMGFLTYYCSELLKNMQNK